MERRYLLHGAIGGLGGSLCSFYGGIGHKKGMFAFGWEKKRQVGDLGGGVALRLGPGEEGGKLGLGGGYNLVLFFNDFLLMFYLFIYFL